MSLIKLRFLICIGGAAVVAPASAQSFNYPDFSNTSGLTFQGSAAATTSTDGQVLRVVGVQNSGAGAAYRTSPVALGANATFSTQFDFRLTSPGGVDPADGFTFVLAASPTGLGDGGSGLGYAGVANSVAIEFDTYNNGNPNSFGFSPLEPNSSNHVAVDQGGVLTNSFATNVYGNASCGFANGTPAQNPYTATGCMSNGDRWTATITYNGSLLNVSLFDPTEGTTFSALSNVPLNIAAALGTNTAYVGFTGSTGLGFENEDILSWRFSNTATLPTSGVPETGTWAMMILGMGCVGFVMRRREKTALQACS